MTSVRSRIRSTSKRQVAFVVLALLLAVLFAYPGSGLLTVVPALEVLGPVFGLGLIVWFVWLGVVMLRSSPGVTA